MGIYMYASVIFSIAKNILEFAACILIIMCAVKYLKKQ